MAIGEGARVYCSPARSALHRGIPVTLTMACSVDLSVSCGSQEGVKRGSGGGQEGVRRGSGG
eukprot:2103637-Pyramimonas_sp.AAC.1